MANTNYQLYVLKNYCKNAKINYHYYLHIS